MSRMSLAISLPIVDAGLGNSQIGVRAQNQHKLSHSYYTHYHKTLTWPQPLIPLPEILARPEIALPNWSMVGHQVREGGARHSLEQIKWHSTLGFLDFRSNSKVPVNSQQWLEGIQLKLVWINTLNSGQALAPISPPNCYYEVFVPASTSPPHLHLHMLNCEKIVWSYQQDTNLW